MKKIRFWVVFILAAQGLMSRPVVGQDKSPGLVKQVICLNEVGNADCEMEMRLPTDAYTALKVQNPNTEVFLRRMGWGYVPQEFGKTEIAFQDTGSIVRIKWTTRGLASFRQGRWEVPLLELSRGYLGLVRTNHWEQPLREDPRITIVQARGGEVLLSQAVSHANPQEAFNSHPMSGMTSAGTALTQIKTPFGFENAEIVRSPLRLVLASASKPPSKPSECVKPAAEGQHASVDGGKALQCDGGKAIPCTACDLDVRTDFRPRLMSCVAKSYGTESASTLWAAKIVVTNNGPSLIKNLKARLRISVNSDSDCTAWESFDEVLPNQTVTVAFHPLLNPHILARNDGTQRGYSTIEYSWQTPAGEEVKKSVDQKIEILGRNDVVFSSFTNDEQLGFTDKYNNMPLVLASMTTKDDPVVQMVAGRISGMANQISASTNDVDAIKFLRAIHAFLACNRIAYQTPPGNRFHFNEAQHVKYARDVFRNRAGTCIDLAITYASLCEAVGLEPILVVTQGHCFPAILLPGSKSVYAVEATCLNVAFEQAAKLGAENWKKRSSDSYVINVRTLRDQGVYPLDLPALSESVLDSWHLTFPSVSTSPKNQSPDASSDGTQGEVFESNQSKRAKTSQIKNEGNVQLEKQLAELTKSVSESNEQNRKEREASRELIKRLEQQQALANQRLLETERNRLEAERRMNSQTTALRIPKPETTVRTSNSENRSNPTNRSFATGSGSSNAVVRQNDSSTFTYTNQGQTTRTNLQTVGQKPGDVTMDHNGMRIVQPDGSILVMDSQGMRTIRP
jgi:hypothetical protein